MCYTPPISFFTAATEFALAIWMKIRYRRATLAPFGSALMVFLGMYQFSEFLLCTMPFPEIWVRMGFISYSYLPAIALHSVIRFLKLRVPVVLLYAVPILATLASLTPGALIAEGTCNTIFVTAHNFPQTPFGAFGFLIYSAYYASFIIAAAGLSLAARKRAHDENRKKLFTYLPLAILSMTVPTFILIIIMPEFGFRFPSVFCHFALLFAALIFTGVRHEERIIAAKERRQ